MFNRIKWKVYAVVPAVMGLALVSGGVMASTGPDFSGILTGLDTATAVTAVIAAAAIIAGLGFAVWAGKKVARFFG